MILEERYVRDVAERALARIAVPAGSAVLFEGSIAEGFGNSGSDLDFLVVHDGHDSPPAMPSLLFVDGRRVEVRLRSAAQVTEGFAAVRSAVRRSAGAPPEDLLNRCQRLVGAAVLQGHGLAARLKGEMAPDELAAVLRGWWTHHARRSLRQALACDLLGDRDDAASWARAGLVQVLKAWLADRGETYLEPKWLPAQLHRAVAGEVARRHRQLTMPGCVEDPAGLRACLEFAADLGVGDPAPDPARLRLRVPRGVTTWRIGSRLHVVRSRREVFVLGDDAARVWRLMVSGRRLDELLDSAAAVDDAGELIARFVRYGLLGLHWQGDGPITPRLPLGAPAGPITPPPSSARPVVRLNGGTVPDARAIEFMPIPAARVAGAGVAGRWWRVLVENAAEDLSGALAQQQWGVAEVAARRIALVSARALLSAHGVSPLPPDSEVVTRLGLLPEDCAGLVARVADAAQVCVGSAAQARGVCGELESTVAAVREHCGAARFPSSFASAGSWDDTLAIGFDWLRLGDVLGSDLPIEEARDLLSGGVARRATVTAHASGRTGTEDEEWV